MKFFYHQKCRITPDTEEDLTPPSLQADIEKTRIALEIAYAGFDNATDEDMIDCYIYEINSLLKRYKHLSALAAAAPIPKKVPSGPSLKVLVSNVLG